MKIISRRQNKIVELIKENQDIETLKTTISVDINLLVDFGIDVITVKSSQNKYYIGSRRFEIPELKLLIDAVQSSKFITAKKSEVGSKGKDTPKGEAT